MERTYTGQQIVEDADAHQRYLDASGLYQIRIMMWRFSSEPMAMPLPVPPEPPRRSLP